MSINTSLKQATPSVPIENVERNCLRGSCLEKRKAFGCKPKGNAKICHFPNFPNAFGHKPLLCATNFSTFKNFPQKCRRQSSICVAIFFRPIERRLAGLAPHSLRQLFSPARCWALRPPFGPFAFWPRQHRRCALGLVSNGQMQIFKSPAQGIIHSSEDEDQHSFCCPVPPSPVCALLCFSWHMKNPLQLNFFLGQS